MSYEPMQRCGAPYNDSPFVTCIRPAGHTGQHITHTDGLIVQYDDHGTHVQRVADDLDRDAVRGLVELAAAERAALPEPPPLVAVELAEAEAEIGEADGYMRMLDPERPWLMLTTDGAAWIQCADCDTWLQAEPGMSLRDAQALAELHRDTDWQHNPVSEPRQSSTSTQSRRERRQAARAERRAARRANRALN
jgi:hypothetical protein